MGWFSNLNGSNVDKKTLRIRELNEEIIYIERKIDRFVNLLSKAESRGNDPNEIRRDIASLLAKKIKKKQELMTLMRN